MVKTQMNENEKNEKKQKRDPKVLYIILSLLIAVVFWLYVDDLNESTISETFTDIPVEFIGAEDTLPNRGLMLSGGEDATLDVTLSGPRQVISELRRGGVWAQVNLSSITAVGTYPQTYTLRYPDNVDWSSITQQQASRYYITVQVSTLYSREIPVAVDVTAPAGEDYMYLGESLTVEPSVISLSGLVDDVDQVESCRVAVDLSDATGTVSQEFTYELLDAEGNVVDSDRIRVSDRRVMVTAPVYMIKELPLTVQFKESPGSRLKNVNWDLEHKSITVAGDPVSLSPIEEIVVGEVDLSNYVDDTEIDLPVKLPADCINLTGEIDQTTLYLSYYGLETRSFSVTNITGIGLSGRQNFDQITAFVNVQLRGSAEDLERVTEEDIRIVVDVSEISDNGTYYEQGKVLVDGFSEVGAVGGCTVAFKITS